MVKHPEPEMGTDRDVILQRILAFLIDGILMGIIAFILVVSGAMLGALFGGISEAASVGFIIFMSLIVVVLTLFYSFLLEGYMGQTLGKKALGLVVVKEDGSKCTYEASIIRNLLRIVDSFPQLYVIGFISIAMSDKSQRVGDRLANTVVVETKR